MIHNVVMPHLGLTMEEGSVASWKKHLGDRVEKGKVLSTCFVVAAMAILGVKVPNGKNVSNRGD